MHLDKGQRHAKKGVPQGNAGVGKGSRIDDHKVHPLGRRLMQGINQLMLGVTLHKVHGGTQLIGPGFNTRVNITQRI